MREKLPKKKENSKSSVSTNPSLGQLLLGGTLQGFTFGSGSAIAHNIFRPTIINEKKNCGEILDQYEKICNNKINFSFEEDTNCKELWNNVKKYCE